MAVQFSRRDGERIIRGIRSIEGMSSAVTAPPKNPRHPRRKNSPASGGVILWQADENYAAEDSDLCAEQSGGGITQLRVKVTRRPCGVSRVFGEDDNGYIDVFDDSAGGFLDGRSAADISGVGGFAMLMGPPPGGYDCQWVITWINWFQERQFVQDWYISGMDIVEEKVNAKVWDWCQLPDEITPGTDCENGYS